MITRQTKLQLLVFAIVSFFGLAYAGAAYADLDDYFRDEGYIVGADFVDSGGMFVGSEVTYRGVRVGSVDELVLQDDGVLARLKLDTGVEVPTGARAVVANRSAVGEQYVDLQPARSGAPYMQKGDVIPRGDAESCGQPGVQPDAAFNCTTIPIQPTELLVNLDDFITSVDTADVQVALRELGTAFEGAGDDLQRLVDAGDLLTRSATDALPETLALINDGETVLDTQRDTSEQFKSFNRDLASLSQQIRDSDPDFRRLFSDGAAGATELTDVIERNRTDLPVLLSNLITVAQVQKVRLPAIRQILVTYPNVAAGGYTVTPNDGTAHFGLVTSQEPGVCGDQDVDFTQDGEDGSGYNNSNRPYEDTDTQAPDSDVFCGLGAAPLGEPEPEACADPASTTCLSVRGARATPRAPGLQPFEGNGQGTSPRPPAGSAVAGSSTMLGDYDPSTGRSTAADGSQLTIGTSAGAARVFGGQSWQWLLAGPLSAGQ